MKYSFDFSKMPDFVLIKTGEFAVVDDFYKLLKDLTDSSRWIKGAAQIVDHRLHDLSRMTPEDMKSIFSIVEFYSDRLGNGKCAFIVTGDIAQLAAQFYTQSAQDLHSAVGVFTSLAEAEKWLFLSPVS